MSLYGSVERDVIECSLLTLFCLFCMLCVCGWLCVVCLEARLVTTAHSNPVFGMTRWQAHCGTECLGTARNNMKADYLALNQDQNYK